MAWGASEIRCRRDASHIARFFKRSFDIVFCILALLAFLPVFLVIAAVIKTTSNGPIFFAHNRVGRNGEEFACLKFRTMVMDAEERLEAVLRNDPRQRMEWDKSRKLKNDPRVIPIVGEFLRKSSLDEVPQFINVLMGDMSVVGPRPVTEEELLDYGPAKELYKSVRPGVTGLWQASGRSSLTFEQRVKMDTEYVRNWSFGLDLKLVFKTAILVISCRDSF